MKRVNITEIGSYVITVIFSIWSIFPLIWMTLTSFKTGSQLSSIPPIWFFIPSLENFSYIFGRTPFTKTFINSLIICLSATALSILIGSLSGYAFSRLRFRLYKETAFSILIIRMLPPIVIIIPLFVAVRIIGLYDQHITLILLYTSLAVTFVVWMLKAFFDEIPRDLEESAMIDGCTRLGAFVRVIIPIASPGIIATSIFSFILSWNEYLFASILTAVNAKTVPVALGEVIGGEIGINWGQMSAEGVIFVIPVLFFSWFVQRHLIKGLTMGAVKG